MTIPVEEIGEAEKAQTQQGAFIEGELRHALQHLAVAAAFVEIDGIADTPEHNRLTAEIIRRLGTICGSTITIEAVSSTSLSELAQAATIEPALLSTDTEHASSNPATEEAIADPTPDLEAHDTRVEPDDTPADTVAEIEVLTDNAEHSPAPTDPLGHISATISLSARDEEIARAMLKCADSNTNDWFQQKDLDFTTISFSSDSARRQAFSKLTLRLIEAGVLVGDGIKGGRKYRFIKDVQASPTQEAHGTSEPDSLGESPKPTRTSAPEQSRSALESLVFIRASRIRIGESYYDLKNGESRVLNMIKNGEQALSAEDVVEQLSEMQQSSDKAGLLDQVEDTLMDLHKRGILSEEVEFLEEDEIPRYTINLDIAETIANKNRVYIGDKELFLDDFDAKILKIVFNAQRGISPSSIAQDMSGEPQGLERQDFDRLIRTLKKYFVAQGIMHRRGPRAGIRSQSHFAISNECRDAVAKVIARL